jgi:hypothetical protein
VKYLGTDDPIFRCLPTVWLRETSTEFRTARNHNVRRIAVENVVEFIDPRQVSGPVHLPRPGDTT